MFNYIIYKYTSPNGKVYVGQTKNEDVRKKAHKYDAINNRDDCVFHRAIRKYGFDSFSYEVICSCKNRDEANAMEKFFINKYDSYANGYNMTQGGEGLLGVKGADCFNSKDMEHFSTKPTLRYDFKNRVCKRQGWEFTEFIEVFVGVKSNNNKLFCYFHKNNLPSNIDEIVENGKMKEKQFDNRDKYIKKEYDLSKHNSDKLLFRSNFRKACQYRGWNFDDFEEIYVESKRLKCGKLTKLFRYVYKGDDMNVK